MPGSRKGERRGGANPNRPKRAHPTGKPHTNVRKAAKRAGLKPVAFDDPVLASVIRAKVPPAQTERQLEAYRMASGENLRLPKEVMLGMMHYFEETTHEYHQVMGENMQRAAAAKTPEQRAVYEAAVSHSEQMVKEYALLTVDVAARCAPFCHPRLAAVMTGNQPGGQESPWNVLGLLMKDLDEAGKAPRYIEHDPQEGQRDD